MKKLTIDKSEEIAEVIDRMLAVEDADVTLVIPKNSALAKSASNFRLLKREAGLADKTVTIESGDENVLAFANANGLTVSETGHTGNASHGMAHHRAVHGISDISDIVVKTAGDADDDEDEDVASRYKKGPTVKLAVHGEEEQEGEKSFFDRDRFFKPRVVLQESQGRDSEDDEEGPGGGISGKAVAWIVGIVVVIAVLFYAVTAIFGHTQITIDFTQTPWTYEANVIAGTSFATTSESASGGEATLTIPAQVFTTQKNITLSFPATGASASVTAKAQGTITIYNDYSAAPQDLVATTRFMTPDGKIFRLVNNVTIPGAQVANGTTTPSSITASIIADQGGPAYNLGPVAKLTIPGFQKSPAKYAGFYGAITGQTTGGFVGVKQVPTTADIAGAKASTTAKLQQVLQEDLATIYPGNFKILDGATDVQITKLTASTSTDANGKFNVFGEATLLAIGFDKSALENYLLGLAQSHVANGGTVMAFKDFAEPNYSNVQTSFSKGQVDFSLSAQEMLEPAFSAGDFASSVAGKSISDARNAIQALPQLSNGTISVWPIWLWSMPSDPKKIQVTAN